MSGIDPTDRVKKTFRDSVSVIENSVTDVTPGICESAQLMIDCLGHGHKILACGNGGSAADAQHFAAELVGRFQKARRALPAMALTTDPSVMTALGNDLGYDAVFRRQVEAHGRAGDIALAISTSGRSRNVLEGVRAARALGMLTVGLSGGGGGDLAGLVDELIDVPSSSTQRIQEVHVMVIHMLCEAIEEAAAQ